MRCLGKQVEKRSAFDGIFRHLQQILPQLLDVAGDVNNRFRLQCIELDNSPLVHARTWRIGHDVQWRRERHFFQLLRIQGVKRDVVGVICRGIFLRECNGQRKTLNNAHALEQRRIENPKCSNSPIQIKQMRGGGRIFFQQGVDIVLHLLSHGMGVLEKALNRKKKNPP